MRSPRLVPARRRHALPWAVAIAALALGTAACTTTDSPATGADPSPPADPGFVVSGAVVLDAGTSFTRDGRGGCAGTGDHADIHNDTPVVIDTDGGASPSGQLTDGRSLMNGTCRFWFAVRGVPAGQDRYRIRIADSDGQVYGEAQLKETLVTLHLG